MKYLSLCSGIEAATQAWHPLGWTPVAFSEIEKFPSAVLAHHYSNVPNWGDMTKFQEWPDAAVDLLVGGTPCQSFSVAGLRKGLADPRGNLALTYLAIAERYRPRWLVWENVPGVLSSSGGRDFGSFLGALAKLGYGFAYRVLDAQFVRTRRFPRAVPQRRRRVFVVGHLGDWRRAAAVLFDGESLSGNSPPRRESGEGASGRAARSIAIRGRDGTPQAELGEEVANAILTPNGGRAGVGVGAFLEGPAHSLRGEGFDASEDGTGRGTPMVPVLSSGQANAELCHGVSPALNCNRDGAPIPFDTTQITSPQNGSNPQPGDPCHPLAAGAHAPTIAFAHQAGGKQTTLGATIAFSASDYATGDFERSDVARPLTTTADRTRGAPIAVEGHGGTWRCRDCGHVWNDQHAQAEEDRDSLSPPECERCGNESGNEWLGKDAIAFKAGQGEKAGGLGIGRVSPTLSSADSRTNRTPAMQQGMAVRRLTPRESERLQGFPDDFTRIPWRGKEPENCPDGPRYKALGNSMAVNVMQWIGERIQMVELQ